MAFQWLFKEISKTWGCRAGETTRQMLPGRSKVRRVRLTPLNMGRIWNLQIHEYPWIHIPVDGTLLKMPLVIFKRFVEFPLPTQLHSFHYLSSFRSFSETTSYSRMEAGRCASASRFPTRRSCPWMTSKQWELRLIGGSKLNDVETAYPPEEMANPRLFIPKVVVISWGLLWNFYGRVMELKHW